MGVTERVHRRLQLGGALHDAAFEAVCVGAEPRLGSLDRPRHPVEGPRQEPKLVARARGDAGLPVAELDALDAAEELAERPQHAPLEEQREEEQHERSRPEDEQRQRQRPGLGGGAVAGAVVVQEPRAARHRQRQDPRQRGLDVGRRARHLEPHAPDRRVEPGAAVGELERAAGVEHGMVARGAAREIAAVPLERDPAGRRLGPHALPFDAEPRPYEREER